MNLKDRILLERLSAGLFGVCATLAILPTFQKLNVIIPLQKIAVVVGILVLIGICVISRKIDKMQNR